MAGDQRIMTADLRQQLVLPLAAAVATGLILGVLGPFGSYLAMQLPVRIVHFLGIVLFTTIGSIAANTVVDRLVFRREPPVWAQLLIAIVLAIPTTLVVAQSLRLFAPLAAPHVGLWALFGQTLFLNLVAGGVAVAWRAWTMRQGADGPPRPAISAVARGANDTRPDAHHATPAPILAVSQTTGLGDRLPAHLASAAIRSLSAEDHYLRVRTARGEALILMPIGEAEAALEGLGLRIHRSHWVALAAIDGLERTRGRDFLRVGEDLLPIARNRRQHVIAVASRVQKPEAK